MPGDRGEDGPVLICYDGSDGARDAVAQEAGAVLRGGAATVLTVWESLGSAVLAHPPPGASGIAREARAISEDVVEVLGSRGRSGGRSVGSVSYGVVDHSRRPVLIVPRPS